MTQILWSHIGTYLSLLPRYIYIKSTSVYVRRSCVALDWATSPGRTELDKCRVTMMPQFHSRIIQRYSMIYFLVSQRWAILKTLLSIQVLSSTEPPCLRSSLYTSSIGLEWPSRCCNLWKFFVLQWSTHSSPDNLRRLNWRIWVSVGEAAAPRTSKQSVNYFFGNIAANDNTR